MDCDYGLERELSDLQKMRLTYLPQLPPCLQGTSVRVECGDATSAIDPSDAQTIGRLFPHTYGQPLVRFLSDTAELPSSSSSSTHNLTPMRVGVVFCGRQSPGGNNVVWGIYNALKTHNPDSVLLGFLRGSEGLFEHKTLEITDDILSTYKNQGGYDLLGREKDQIRTIEQVNSVMAACTSLKLDGLVIIGGVTPNTDAAQLAEAFAEAKCQTKVVGVPVTLNGDLKSQFVETNVGFDTICKVNSQLISNVCTDALSAEKYYYFIRLMGGKASHVALECTLQSHPNMVILSEEVSASKLTLSALTKQICDTVQARAEQDKYYGVILLPEGLIESIPEVYALLQEIHGLLEQGVSVDKISSQLSPSVSALFEFLPPFLREKLLLSPESDDSAQLSQIETEKLLAHLVEIEMNKRLKEGTYKGKKFNAICYFFGYQARGSLPSKFDCDYAFVLGHVCYHTLVAGLTGYLATVTNLKNPVDKWCCCAVPITAMMTLKRFGPGPGASSPGKPALHPTTVDLKGKAYDLLRQNATKFLMDDVYRNLEPLQFDGPGADSKSATLCVEDQDCMRLIKEEEGVVDQVISEISPPLALEIDNQSTTAAAELGIDNQSTTAAAELGDVPQSYDQEETINSEPLAVLESREDEVPEAVEYVLVDSKDGFPTSKPEEEKALVTKDPSDGQIQDAAVQNDSSENENSLHATGELMKSESVGGDLLCPVNDTEEEEALVTKYPRDCRVQEAVVQYGSSEIDNNLQSPVDLMKPEIEASDILRPVYNAAEAEEEKEASVIKSPCDCRIEDAAVQNGFFENDSNNFVVAEEIEEALLTIYPCDCPVEDAAIQNDSLKNDTNLHSPGDLMKTETKGDDHLCPLKNVVEAEEEALLSNDLLCPVNNVAEAEEDEEAPITKYPCDFQIQDAAVQKNFSKIDNNLHVTPETVADQLLCPVNKTVEAEKEEETSVTEDPSDIPIQDAAVQKDFFANDNNLHSPGEFKTPETDRDGLLCPVNNTVESEEEEEGSVTKNLRDCQIQDAGVLKDSSENGNDLHSPDTSMKPETEEGDVLCPVNNGAEVEVEVTKAFNKDTDISNTETSSHPLAAGVVIPVVSYLANGGLIQDVASRSVADMISDSKIQNSSSTNGMNTSCIDASVISRAPVQFGSFVPAICQVNGVCGDDVSKPPPSPEVVSALPKIEQSVAVEVESVERPFNFLIRMPKYYDDELNEQIRQAELQVADKTQNREDIKFKMQVIRGNLQQARRDYTAKASEERDARRLVKLKRQEIDSVQSIINRVKNAISVEDIDSRIKHMEHMMQHETLPLKEEKQFIREIKQLKLYREQLSSNMGSQDEVRKAIDERDQIEEQLKLLKKDLERLKQKVLAAEATAVAADTKLKEEKKRLEELYAQHGSAQNIRQKAYMNMQNLRKQFYDKNARFRTYKDDAAAAIEYASNRDKGALHRLCLNQVEKMMELWNNDDEFRKEYIRCNTRSTMWRLRTMDGRAPGPDEELPVVTSFVDERIKSSRYRVGQVNPELPLVSTDLDKKEEPLPTTQAITECKFVEKVSEQTNKAEKAKKKVNPSMRNISPPINSLVETVETLEEVSNKKQPEEEQEVARKEEQSRKAAEEAKLKEQRRLEEIAKAKEALERKRRTAVKALTRAEVRAQKEAEQKDKEKEKRAKKKERKKAGVGGDEGGDIIAPTSDLTAVTTMKESETKEVNPSAAGAVTASKRHQKAFTKQLSKIKTVSSIPPPLRNKNKRKWQQWIWLAVCAAFVIAAVLVGNMGISFYPNHLGRNRHPGF